MLITFWFAFNWNKSQYYCKISLIFYLMSKWYRLMTNNIRTTSFSITIITHYRPRSKVCANGIFLWQIKSHDYKNIQNKSYKTFKGCVTNIYDRKYQDILTCGYLYMTFERGLLTMKETLTFKCILPLAKWSHYYDVFVMIKNKHKFYWLLQNYNICSKK